MLKIIFAFMVFFVLNFNNLNAQLFNNPQDPFMHSGVALDSSEAPCPYGLIGEYNFCFQETDNNKTIGNSFYNLNIYYENFQVQFEQNLIGNALSFVHRTTGRDAYNSLKLGCIIINTDLPVYNDEYYLESKYLLLLGYNFINGYSDKVTFADKFGIQGAIDPFNINDQFYFNIDYNIGLRVPINRVGVFFLIGGDLSLLSMKHIPVPIEKNYNADKIFRIGLKLSLILTTGIDL